MLIMPAILQRHRNEFKRGAHRSGTKVGAPFAPEIFFGRTPPPFWL